MKTEILKQACAEKSVEGQGGTLFFRKLPVICGLFFGLVLYHLMYKVWTPERG